MDIKSSEDLGGAVREARLASGLTQQQLATAARVSRKLIVELEAGHQRAELGKALMVLSALGIGLTGHGTELQRTLQALIGDKARSISRELAHGDHDFALRLAVDLFTEARDAGDGHETPFLRRPEPTGNPKVDTLILAGLRWALGSKDGDLRPWPAPKALRSPWFAYGFRGLSEAWKDLSTRETPPELASANVYIRERSLIST